MFCSGTPLVGRLISIVHRRLSSGSFGADDDDAVSRWAGSVSY
jgi:hypothetical protein